MSGSFAGQLVVLADVFDGADAEVIVYDLTWVPVASAEVVADIPADAIVAREPVTLAAESVDGTLVVDFAAPVEVTLGGAGVGGWAVALDGVDDSARRLLRWADVLQGVTTDPFQVVAPGGLIVFGPAAVEVDP